MVVVCTSVCVLFLYEAMVSVIKLITVIYIGSLMVCDSI